MGIYTFLEDKWYDLIDWLNQYVPVANIVDSVDRVVPSFILFLAFLILILIGLFVFVFAENGIGFTQFSAEVTVLSKQGAPITQAVISFQQDCSNLGEVTLRTDASGKAIFKACSSNADIKISKEGYTNYNESISFEDNKAKIYLSSLASVQRILNLKVKDSSRKIIEDAQIYLVCVKNGVIDENLVENKNQSTSGFLITIPSGCDTIQIKAVADGYVEKKETIGLAEDNKTITLERTDTSGTVVFTVDSNSGKKEAIILVSDELGREDTILINSTGAATKEYSAGDYSYIATMYGFQKTGNFVITTNQTVGVDIFFSDVTPTVVAPIAGGTAPGIYLKLLDGNTGVGGAEVRVFFKKGNDTNYLTKLSSSYSGIVGHSPVTDANNREFYVIIKSIDYETKLVKVDLKTAQQSPQEITLSKGGAYLKVKVIDDINAPIKNAVISLRKNGFGSLFEEPLTTDNNGTVKFDSLPNGTYSIKGVTLTHEGSIDSISLTSDKEVILKLITGTGNVKFNLLHKGDPANAYCELKEQISGEEDLLLSSAITTNGYYQATALKADKKIYLTVPDTNYIYVESPIVSVKRTAQTKNIILYKESDLPNSNKVQMFLEGVYESNPWTTAQAIATKLMPGKSYYFLFTLIANSDTNLNTYANVFVSPKDKNTIDANTKIFVEDAFSTRASIVRTSQIMNSSIIPEDAVNSPHAKQLNVYFGEQTGLRALPMVVQVSVDANATGAATLYWEGLAGDIKSVLYSKEFTVGQSFCFGVGKCPELLFSNYFKRSDSEVWIPIGGDYPLLQVGDLYDLNVIVENLTDREIGAANLVGKIKSQSQTKLLFNGDLNSVSVGVNVSEFDKNWARFSLDALATTASATMIESLEKGTELNTYNGNNSELKFDIRKKEDINIQVIATSTINVIHANTSYSLFYLKTFYKSNRLAAKTIWEAKVKGENFSLRTNETDTNGEWLGAMDFSAYPAGTVIVFTARDENFSNPANLEITLTDAFLSPTIQTIPDCVEVKINGANINSISIPVINSQVGSTGGSFTLDSNCIDSRDIIIRSDLGVSTGNRFSIAPNESKTVTLNDPASVINSRGGVLGAYPMQIMQIVDTTKFNQIGFIDIVVNDPNSIFTLENAILDLRSSNSASSKITNNKLSGRMDNFYPKMNISTNSVGLTYKKPGNPGTISFTAKVVGAAIESVLSGFGWGSILFQKSHGASCSSTVQDPTAPEELLFTENYISDCVEMAEAIASQEPAPKEEPDSPLTDPTIPFYSLPLAVQNQIISQIYPTSGNITSIPTDNNSDVNLSSYYQTEPKVKRASFEEVNVNVNGETVRATCDGSEGGLIYYPGPLGDIESEENCVYTNEMGWVAAGRPPGFGSCAYEDCWNGISERPHGEAAVLQQKDCDKVEIVGLGFNGEAIIGKFYTKGEEKINWGGVIGGTLFCGPTCGIAANYIWPDEESCKLKVQTEFFRTLNFQQEVKKVWEKDFNLLTSESVVQSVGSYTSATPTPKWTNLTTSKGHSAGDTWTEGDKAYVLMCVQGMGFVPPETGSCKEGSYDLGNYGSPLIEFDPSGYIKYEIPADSIPEGTRAFLKDGKYYVEYFGIPEIDSKDINFTVTKINLIGSEYAIIEVTDWVDTTGTVVAEPVEEVEEEVEPEVDSPTLPGFLWKPFSESNGNLVVLYSPDAGDPEIYDSEGELIEVGVKHGGSNGYSQTARFSQPGSSYPAGSYFQAGEYRCEVDSPGSRIEACAAVDGVGAVDVVPEVFEPVANMKKVTQSFQVKLVANPNNCYSLEGAPGLTGKEFAPRLSFDWNWSGIAYNQCESTNPGYTYCDSTQFTISTFKRIEKINDLLNSNNNRLLPQYATFYAYLIKDGYSADFLKDFDQYYSTTAFASTNFNSTGTVNGYDKFISENKIDFSLRNGSTIVPIPASGLPTGGLYRVEIGIDFENEAINSLFNQGNTNAQIHVIFTLINQASNYNLFYETPFDGEVGKQQNGTFSRIGYGSSLDQGEIPITSAGVNSLRIRNYSGSPLVSLNYTTSSGLTELMNQKVLTYTRNGLGENSLEFNPMQPTPVVMNIKSTDTNTVRAPYTMSGQDSSVKTDRDWRLISSTISDAGKCADFSNNQTYSFIEQTSNSNANEKYFQWNATKTGTIELATIFFTPAGFQTSSLNSSSGTTMLDVSSAYAGKVKLLTVADSSLASGTSIQLNYFDNLSYAKYTSLKGIFEMIAEGKLCISQNSLDQMQVWWNQNYLNGLTELVNYNKSNSCLD